MAVRTSKTCSSNSCIAEQQDTTTTFYQIKTPDLMSLSVLLFCPPFCLPPLSIFTLCLSAPLVLSFPSMQPALLLGGEGLPPLPHCLLPLRTWVVFHCPPPFNIHMLQKDQDPSRLQGASWTSKPNLALASVWFRNGLWHNSGQWDRRRIC